MRRIAQRSGQPVVINVRGLAASIANQEDAVVVAAGMAVRHIGVGAFHAPGKVGPHEQVQNSVNTVGRDSLARRDPTLSAMSYAEAGFSCAANASNTSLRMSVHCSPAACKRRVPH